MVFSIIVVCLNAGEKLRETIESIRRQTEKDYEIILKDGGSTDELTKRYLKEYGDYSFRKPSGDVEPDDRLRLYCGKDSGIYDAMNQAVQYARGDYLLFLNCGDSFYDCEVLHRARQQIVQQTAKDKQDAYIFYGNIYERQTGTLVQSNPVIDDFACYRNLPCHQACFYAAELLKKRAFDISYQVRADYDHFLWCYYRANAKTIYMPLTVAFYEGGGFSEARENERKSRQEHRQIVGKYMPALKVLEYRMIMVLTLAPVRTLIAKNPLTAGIYQRLKGKLYRK